MKLHSNSLFRKARPFLVMGMLGSVLPSKAQLQISIERKNVGGIQLAFPSSDRSYYLLEEASSLTRFFTASQMQIGTPPQNIFSVEVDAPARFFRVNVRPLNEPLDSDGDGLDDVYELKRFPALNPLIAIDPEGDLDGDGISNAEEAALGWDPTSRQSPTPVELGHSSGGTRFAAISFDTGISTGGGALQAFSSPAIPNLVKIYPEVSVNDSGLVAFIADIRNSSGGTNSQIFVTKRNDDGSFTTGPVLTDAQVAGTAKLGPGVSINNDGQILVRRAFRDSSPLGAIVTTFIQTFNGNVLDGQHRGEFQTIASAEPLSTFAEFTSIDENCAINNKGSVAFFAQDKSARYLVAQSSAGAFKTTLSAAVLFTPLSLSDVDTVAFRRGDAQGAIRLHGLPNVGDRLIWSLNAGASGFSDFGRHPGISRDGRILAFYANYNGVTNENIGTTGPGIFALVSTQAIISASVASSAILVRIAGIAGNGKWDPSEEWTDENENRLVDGAEDKGAITQFYQDSPISPNADGLLTFKARLKHERDPTAPISAFADTSFDAFVGTELQSFSTPAPGCFTPVSPTQNDLAPASHYPLSNSDVPIFACKIQASNSGRDSINVAEILRANISARLKGTLRAPKDGLILTQGGVVEIAFSPRYFDKPNRLQSEIGWSMCQLQRDGTYSQWQPIGTRGVITEFTFPAGSFQLRAESVTQEKYLFTRKWNANFGENDARVFNPRLRKGEPDFIGVAATESQVLVRNEAKRELGSTFYARDAAIRVGFGVDDGMRFRDSPKCSIFVFRIANSARAPVPTREFLDKFPLPRYRNVAPGAFEWFNTGPIGRWELTQEPPQPGFIVSRMAVNVDLGGTGHVGILDYDGTWISAGPRTVNKSIHLEDEGFQPAHFRRFQP